MAAVHDSCFGSLLLEGCCTLDDRMFLIGGSDTVTDLSTAATTVLSLSLSQHAPEWKTLSPIPGEGRAIFAATTCNGKIYVFGGCQR